MPELSEMSVQALQMRQKLGRFLVSKIRQDWREEPGAKEAIQHYEGQVAEITEELRRRRREQRAESGEERPPDLTVAMKTAKLGSKAQG